MIVSGTGLPVVAHRWLREIDTGLWEGLTWDEARQRYPREYALREHDILGYPFPGGESFRELEARVVPRFLDLIDEEQEADHERVLIVAHKTVNRVLLAHFLGLPLEELFSIQQEYCAVNVLRVSKGPDGGLHVLAEPAG
jgi:alpha-ribazole phosphatase